MWCAWSQLKVPYLQYGRNVCEYKTYNPPPEEQAHNKHTHTPTTKSTKVRTLYIYTIIVCFPVDNPFTRHHVHTCICTWIVLTRCIPLAFVSSNSVRIKYPFVLSFPLQLRWVIRATSSRSMHSHDTNVSLVWTSSFSSHAFPSPSLAIA